VKVFLLPRSVFRKVPIFELRLRITKIKNNQLKLVKSFYTRNFREHSLRCARKYEGVSKSFRTESIKKYMLTTINTRSEAT